MIDTSRPIDEVYFEWLYGHIAAVSNRNPARSYWALARRLYQTEYYWSVPNDDNRGGDGKELRVEFLYNEAVEDIDGEWMELECSVLEMLVALAKRASFETDDAVIEWFWILLENIGLRDLNDEVYDDEADVFVDEVIDNVLSRKYDRKGNGGLFPLKNTRYDQRTIELWYQLSSYILEQDDQLGL